MIQMENGLPAHRAPDDWVRRLTEPLPEIAVKWRQVEKPTKRDAKFIARFVAYVDADVVRARLDEVVPGEWDLTMETLPLHTLTDKQGTAIGSLFTVKARLQILGVIRENIGQSDKDWKAAATDAFKRAAARYGIGHELGAEIYKNIWVEVDGDGKYAKRLGDPAAVLKQKKVRLLERSGANRGGAQAPARPQSASAGQERSPAAPPARTPRERPDNEYDTTAKGGAPATPLKNGPTPMAARPSGRPAF